MRTTCMLLLLLLYGSCEQKVKKPTAEVAQVPQEVTLKGYYSKSDQSATLHTCAEGKKYRVIDATGQLDSLYHLACLPAPITGEAVYAVLGGTLSNDEQTFQVQRIDTLTAKNWRNACRGWEFWCSGTEPFWSLQISEAEGGIFFKDVGAEEGYAFKWVAPKTDGKSTWTYETDGLKVTIKKGDCSDGMSEIQYRYQAELTVNGRPLKGCAIRNGEPFPSEE